MGPQQKFKMLFECFKKINKCQQINENQKKYMQMSVERETQIFIIPSQGFSKLNASANR